MADAQRSPMIGELNRHFAEAFKTRNFAAVAGLFTDDAVMLPPRRNIITGRSRIQSFWTKANRMREMHFETDIVTPLGGDVIREIGTLKMRIERPAASRDEGISERVESHFRVIRGKYVFLWRKVDGEWRLETSIWNRNRPENARRRQRDRRDRE
jgi:ketosteroid isomerase-like protein